VSATPRNPDQKKGVRRGRPTRRRIRGGGGPAGVALSRDDRLIWLSIAAVAGVDGGILAGLLTAVAGGTRQAALAAGGAAALGTFGAVLAIVRFLHDSSEK
jgi:hypothetical protein